MVAEAFAYHRMDMSGGRWQDYGRGVRNMVARGALYGAADYIQAQRFRSYFAKEAAKVMATVDILVTPSIVEPAGLTASMDMSKRMLQPSYAGPFNLLGYPALAIPSGFSSGGLPLSTQIVGAPFAEALTLKVGHAYQQVTAQHLAVPPIVLEVAAA
jgi:aspartyl-tRNA(Asn)/glutamyl-tRNA(Gln) amidotransferase subunit A